MREASYTDAEGRMWAVHLPEGVLDSDAPLGIPLGPPSLEPLGLPLDVEVRIHNQLFGRQLFTLKDVKARRMDILGALQAAFKVDIVAIAQLYRAPERAAAPTKPKPTEEAEPPRRGRRKRRR